MAQPIRLATLQVVAAPVAQTTNASSGNAELARVRLDDGWLDDQQAGEGDVFRALADAPGVEARGERSGGLHVRGGANADKLVLLDGIPVFSAVHYASSASAINPDAVAGAELHPGVTSAQFGEHLSGVVELETRDAGPDPFAARGAFGSGEIRQSFTGYLPALRTGISVGGRTTYRNALMSEGYDGDATDGSGYRDFLAVATSDVGGGRLRALSFLSSNTLAFPAFGDSPPTSGDWGENAYIPRNDIGWTSWSQGLTWSRTDTRVKLETAAWASGSSADVAWRGAEGPERVQQPAGGAGDLRASGVARRIRRHQRRRLRHPAEHELRGDRRRWPHLPRRADGRVGVRRARVASRVAAPVLRRTAGQQRLRRVGRARAPLERRGRAGRAHAARHRGRPEPPGAAVGGERRVGARASPRIRPAGGRRRGADSRGARRPARGVRGTASWARDSVWPSAPTIAAPTVWRWARRPPATSSLATASSSARPTPRASRAR